MEKVALKTLDELCNFGQSVIDIEQKSVLQLKAKIDATFAKVCETMLQCKGHIIVMGMGKSGHIGRKIAATLSSTGTPSFFVHPGEASHGDMGMITSHDVVLLLSYSGTTSEVITLIPFIKRLNVPIISLTGNPESSIATMSRYHLDVSVPAEACPLDLAPTASTTATLVMGDTIALTLLKARGFTEEDFARSHPAGALGRRLTKIEDLMHTGKRLPRVNYSASLSEALLEMTQKGLGMTGITLDDGKLVGVFTDGDLRRALKEPIDISTKPVAEVMTAHCKTISPDALAADAIREMEENKINGFLVVDNEHKLIGALNMHDLLKEKVL